MLRRVEIAQKFLLKKFGSADQVPPGIYCIPIDTSKGNAFMKVRVDNQTAMHDFTLWWDQEFTKPWH